MGLDDRLVKDSRKRAEDSGKEPYYAEEPDWLIYDERKKQPYMNKNRGVFETSDEKALNTSKSVFDRTAVFALGSGKKEEQGKP